MNEVTNEKMPVISVELEQALREVVRDEVIKTLRQALTQSLCKQIEVQMAGLEILNLNQSV